MLRPTIQIFFLLLISLDASASSDPAIPAAGEGIVCATRGRPFSDSLNRQMTVALQYVPELRNVNIQFRIRKRGRGIIATQPTLGSLLRRGDKRRYLIIIYDNPQSALPVFTNCPFDGQVGILVHELCHIVDFKNKSGLQLMGHAAGHLSRRYIQRFERKTDSAAVERGAGKALIAWNMYLQQSFSSQPYAIKVPAHIQQRYLSIEEIKMIMEQKQSLDRR